jgi:flavin-dependent dehydrogenase
MKIVILGAGTAGLVTALMLKEKYPFSTITIIKSKEIGIVGVGEGSTEHWNSFMQYVRIDPYELIYKTDATLKIGILFKNWIQEDRDYVHSISDFRLAANGQPELYHHLYLKNLNKKFPLVPGFEEVWYKNITITPPTNQTGVNQFHFDTFKLGEFLLSKCLEVNISIIDDIVSDVAFNNAGEIKELITKNNIITGDIFIDCSGFKRVLSSKLGNKWVPKTKYLPMNRAIAFPTTHNIPGEIEPYTTATALSAGWSWRIPTQKRYGNGYVFNTDYISADQALGELNKVLNCNVENVARDIPFEAGKLDKFWIKNVISIGLAGSFAEPLEAQSIGFTIIQNLALMDYLDTWHYNKEIVSKKYNEDMDIVYENIVSYLQLHYLGNRDDTKFWKDKPFELTDFLKENLPAFKHGIFERTLFTDFCMFKTPNWYQVMAGLNLIDKKEIRNNLLKNKEKFNFQNEEYANFQNNLVSRCNVMSHSDLLKYIRFNYMFKNKIK